LNVEITLLPDLSISAELSLTNRHIFYFISTIHRTIIIDKKNYITKV